MLLKLYFFSQIVEFLQKDTNVDLIHKLPLSSRCFVQQLALVSCAAFAEQSPSVSQKQNELSAPPQDSAQNKKNATDNPEETTWN